MSTIVDPRVHYPAVAGVSQTLRRRPGLIVPILASALVMTAGAALALVVAALTLFRARRLYNEVIARAVARTILAIWSIRVVVHADRPWPRTQTIYVSNHTSTIDLFVLVALGLPRARFFLSGYLKRIVPLGVMATVMGTFFTVPQTDRPGRVRVFQRADLVLRTTGESVYLSPEGERVTSGRVGPFNKGAFHLATSLRAPIVPFYIAIPRECDPGIGIEARAGTVHVHVLPTVDTASWRLEDVDDNRRRVHALFMEFHERLHVADGARA